MKFLDVPQSGSIAGNTHSHNRAGQYKRNRRAPVQPIGTGRRAFIRALFGAASAAWSALTDAQRAGWAGFALDHPVTDSLGQSIILTGHQMFVRIYTTIGNVGQAGPTVYPSDLTLPVVSDAVATFGVVAGISINFTGGDPGQFIAVGMSRQMSPGRTFNKVFWQPMGTLGYTSGDGAPYTLTSANYAAQFGTPVVGQRVFFRLTPVSAEGWNGTPVIVSDVIGA